MTNGNFGAGVGAGVAAGISAGMATAMIMSEEEAGKNRRISQQGHDQIIIRTNKSEEETATTVAELFENWYTKGTTIYQKNTYRFDFGNAFLCFFAIGLLLLLTSFIWSIITPLGGQCNYSYHTGCFPLGFEGGIIITLICSIVYGFYCARIDDEINYIKINSLRKGTTVLIKRYNNSGYRNLDEDDIERLYDLFNIPETQHVH